MRPRTLRALRPRARVLAALGPVVLAACAGLSPSARVLDVPATLQEERYACGVAALTSLARYHGRELPAAIVEQLAARAAAQQGLGGADLRAALEELGFESFVFRGALDRSPVGLLRHLDAGRPLLVGLAVDDEAHHFVLFTGYDEPTRRVVLLDPAAHGRMVVGERRFIEAWQRAACFTLLAVPRPSAPSPGDAR